MTDILNALKNTPIPAILVISGIVFLLLALAGQLGGQISIPATRQKWAAILGVILLLSGIYLSIYIPPNTIRTSATSVVLISTEPIKDTRTSETTNEIVTAQVTSTPNLTEFCRKGVVNTPNQTPLIARSEPGVSQRGTGSIPNRTEVALACTNIEVPRSGMIWVQIMAITSDQGKVIGWVPTSDIDLSYCGTKRANKSGVLIRNIPGTSETYFTETLSENTLVQVVCDSEIESSGIFWFQIRVVFQSDNEIVGWVPAQDLD